MTTKAEAKPEPKVETKAIVPYMPKPLAIGFASLVILAIAVVPSVYLYQKYQESQTILKNPNVAAQKEAQTVLSKVGHLMQLPKETPTLATVTDESKLKSQTFFANAANGDQVLIFTNAREAVLYRPSTNMIIQVAPITVSDTQGNVAGVSTSSPSASLTPETAKVTATLYNGTTTVGLAGVLEKKLAKEMPSVKVSDLENAKKNDYKKTVVVDLKGTHAAEAQQLAKLVGGEVGSTPQGEDTPSTDLAVFIGK